MSPVESTELVDRGVKVEPKLFCEGSVMDAILMWQAFEDLDYCCYLEEIETIFEVPAEILITRIYRYINGLPLLNSEDRLYSDRALNKEKGPFFAIKAAHCPEGWESFRDRNGSVEELDHLRAYFWEEKFVSPNKGMCITHFALKKGSKLEDVDYSISTDQKVRFENYGYEYAEE